MIQFKTKISLEDYQDFNLFTFKQRWGFKVMKLVGFLFIFLFVSMSVLSFYTGESIDASAYGILFFALIYLFGFPLLIKFNTKKVYHTHKMLQEEILYKIDDAELFMEGESYKSSISWNKIYKVVENKRSIFIFQSKQSGNLIPKHSLTKEQLKELRSIIHSKEGFSKKLRTSSN